MQIVRAITFVAVCAVAAGSQELRPLEASLRRGVGEAAFVVDQPAYVAVFEVLSGHGVQQIFPRSGYQAASPVAAGEYLLSRPLRSQYGSYGWSTAMPYARPVYMIGGDGRVTSYYYATGWSGPHDLSPRRTLLLVASRKPLRRVGSPEASQHWLQQVVGFRAISNSLYAPESMLRDIVDAILPVGTSIDDVVVDVLEVDDSFYDSRRWAGTIQFQCPGGMYSMPAEFFFSTGMFYCPEVKRNVATTAEPVPGGQVPADSGNWETLKLPARKVPPKTDVEMEGYREVRRGNPSTPNAPGALAEEGYRAFPRGVTSTPAASGSPAEEGYRPYRRGGAPSDATITVGVPVPAEAFARGGGNPGATAWVPPSAGLGPREFGYGTGRYSPSGAPTGDGGARSAAGNGGAPSSSAGASPFTSSSPASSPAAAAAAASSAAQADRSAASRGEVSAARAAASKPIDP